MLESRTKKTIKNAQVALIYYFISLLLNFFSRKVFIDCLGAEVLGLNTTITNLLGFLNIAELGIGLAVSYSLYTPLYNKDKETICDIVSIQGWFYRKVAIVVTIGAIILISFFPIIFKKADVPMWYAYATFVVLLFSSLLGYFVNYRQIVLTADQKDYKLTVNLKGFTIIKVIFQILAISYLSNGYMYWLILEMITAIVCAFVLHLLLKREYPWLVTSYRRGYIMREKYPDIILKTKQIFTHKIGGFVLTQTSPLIIYAFTSLTLVAVYGNYMLIITGIAMLSYALFNSMGAGIGNLVAEGNNEKIMNLFWQLASFRIWLSSVFCFAFYTFSHPFISIWIGANYILPHTPFILLTVYLFITQTRNCDVFLNAYGLYKDVWAPIVEAGINIGLSIILGFFWGLTGIIAGVLISLLIIIVGWKPVFLFRNAFKIHPLNYFKQYLKYIILVILSLFLSYILIYMADSTVVINQHILLFAKVLTYTMCSSFIFVMLDKNIKQAFFRLRKK
jgi:O-antigen/teichoic acid export membrane protein